MVDLCFVMNTLFQFIINIWSLNSTSSQGIEGSLGQVLKDELLSYSPGLLEHKELLEDDGFLNLCAHLPSVQWIATLVLQ